MSNLCFQKSGVYMIISPAGYYIGSSKDCNHRFAKHLAGLRNNKHDNLIMQNVFNKDPNDWELVILEEVNEHELLYIEQKYLDIHAGDVMCMNMANKAYHPPIWPKGKKRGPMSEETKYKLSLSNMGQKRTKQTKENISKSKKGIMFSKEVIERRKQTRQLSGYIVSEETKSKISAKQIGRPKSHDHREKIKQTLTGRKHTDEARYKISQAGLGRKHSEESKQKMRESKRQRDLERRSI